MRVFYRHLIVMLVLIVVSLEVGARLYWKMIYGIPFTRPNQILHVFYPNLEILRQENNRPDPTHKDILVLGGSVVDEMRDDFKSLGERKGGNLRFHVAGRVAHTTLDNKRKYEMLEDLPYDEILVYHGINDCKYNSVPNHLFDDGYTAYPFYQASSIFLRDKVIDWFALPYTLRFAWVQYRNLDPQEWRLPVVTAHPHWKKYGSDIKSARTFRRNLEEIIKRAQRNGQPVHLATFASHIPENYTYEKFRTGQLDYNNPRLRMGVWGYAEDIRAWIQIHNEIIRDIAKEFPNARIIDIERTMPKVGRLYDDSCHFSPEGRKHYFDLLTVAL